MTKLPSELKKWDVFYIANVLHMVIKEDNAKLTTLSVNGFINNINKAYSTKYNMSTNTPAYIFNKLLENKIRNVDIFQLEKEWEEYQIQKNKIPESSVSKIRNIASIVKISRKVDYKDLKKWDIFLTTGRHLAIMYEEKRFLWFDCNKELIKMYDACPIVPGLRGLVDMTLDDFFNIFKDASFLKANEAKAKFDNLYHEYLQRNQEEQVKMSDAEYEWTSMYYPELITSDDLEFRSSGKSNYQAQLGLYDQLVLRDDKDNRRILLIL